MSEIYEKLARFTSSVMAEAEAEAEATRKQIEKKRSETLTQAKADAAAAAQEHLEKELARLRADAGRQISMHMLDNKHKLTARRDELGREVFNAVRARIDAYTKTPEYAKDLARSLSAILAKIGSDAPVDVYLRAADEAIGTQLSAPGTSLTLKEGSFKLGGIVVECPSKNLRVDGSFDSAIDELDGHFAELFGLSLADE